MRSNRNTNIHVFFVCVTAEWEQCLLQSARCLSSMVKNERTSQHQRKCNAHISNVPRLARPTTRCIAESADGRRQVFHDAPLHAARTLHVHAHRVTNTSWFAFVWCQVSSTFFSGFVRKRDGRSSLSIGTVVGQLFPIVQSRCSFQAPWRGPIGHGGRGTCARWRWKRRWRGAKNPRRHVSWVQTTPLVSSAGLLAREAKADRTARCQAGSSRCTGTKATTRLGGTGAPAFPRVAIRQDVRLEVDG